MGTIEITVNQWRIPTEKTAFDTWLEGEPTTAQRAEILADVAVKRAAWKPTPEGLEQVEELRQFVGSRVRIQLWDSCMHLLPDEGPNPFEADLVGVVMMEVDGFQQPHLKLSNYFEQHTQNGYSPKSYFKEAEGLTLVALADLYTLTKLSGICHVST